MYLYHYTYNFFHNNRPGKPLPGHSSFLGLFWALFFVGGDGWREGRTDCRRGGCMVVPGAVVSPSHTKRLSLLPCRAPHNSPCTLMRTWLRQMGLTLRLLPQSTFPSEASGAKYDQRLTPTHRVPTMQPLLRQSVLCVGEKQRKHLGEK